VSTASLGINVPDFTSDVSALAEGDPVVIDLTILSEGEPSYDIDDNPVYNTTATFYGRISDLQAVPRDGRNGVTLSVVAVDYTVDLRTLEVWAPGAGPWVQDAFLEQLWDDRIGTAFPTWYSSLGSNAIDPPVDNRNVGDVIDAELIQAAGFTLGEPTHRAIIAPNIDPFTRRLDTTQEWAFDMVYKESPTDPYPVPCHLIEKGSLVWLYSKAGDTNSVTVVSETGSGDAIHPGVTLRRVVNLDVTLTDPDLDWLAELYLPDPVPSMWRVDGFRFHPTRGSGMDAEDLPHGLMPRWEVPPVTDAGHDELDLTERSSCYGRPIELVDVPWHVNPLAVDDDPELTTVTGRLWGASVTVVGGHVMFDMQLRQTS
jgi:hypothetical protein